MSENSFFHFLKVLTPPPETIKVSIYIYPFGGRGYTEKKIALEIFDTEKK